MDQGSNQQPQNESIFKGYKNKLSNFVPQTNSDDTKNNLLNLTKNTEIKQNKPSNNNIKTDLNTNQSNSNQNPISYNNTKMSEQIIQKTNPTLSNTKKQEPIIPTKNKSISPVKGIVILIVKSFLIVIATFFIGYFVVNYQALILKIDYWYQTSIKNQKWSELHPIKLIKAQETVQKLDENYLYIPTIGIQSPVSWGIEDNDLKNLLNQGLVQYSTSNLPDDAKGNIFIIGNTSGPIWDGSNYKTVFTLLNKVSIDQVITIIYNNKIYLYRIYDISYKNNKDLVITPGNENESILNLLAQYPIGLNWKTLIVRAKLYKIESNIVESVGDKIDKLDEMYNDNQLDPVKVNPTPTSIPIPIDNKLPNPELLPQHFLPKV